MWPWGAVAETGLLTVLRATQRPEGPLRRSGTGRRAGPLCRALPGSGFCPNVVGATEGSGLV